MVRPWVRIKADEVRMKVNKPVVKRDTSDIVPDFLEQSVIIRCDVRPLHVVQSIT